MTGAFHNGSVFLLPDGGTDDRVLSVFYLFSASTSSKAVVSRTGFAAHALKASNAQTKLNFFIKKLSCWMVVTVKVRNNRGGITAISIRSNKKKPVRGYRPLIATPAGAGLR